MEKKDVLYDVVKELVSEEEIRGIARDEVRKKLCGYEMEKVMRGIAMEIISEKGEKWIEELATGVINGPVRLDDGWGNVEEMGTFEDYVRKSLRKQCFDQWKLERKLRDMVDERLKKIATDIVNRHLKEDLANEVLDKLVEEVGGKK